MAVLKLRICLDRPDDVLELAPKVRNVMGHDDPTRPDRGEGHVEVLHIVLLDGVNGDEIVRAVQLWDFLKGVAHPERDKRG
jgi:hypothetical protein